MIVCVFVAGVCCRTAHAQMNMTPPTLPSQPLISMMGTMVPTAPPLTGNVDPTKIEEIRRTVYVGNLNSSVRRNEGRGEKASQNVLENAMIH